MPRCPDCGDEAVTISTAGTCRCGAGHVWAVCPVHQRVVLGEPDPDAPGECFCVNGWAAEV